MTKPVLFMISNFGHWNLFDACDLVLMPNSSVAQFSLAYSPDGILASRFSDTAGTGKNGFVGKR